MNKRERFQHLKGIIAPVITPFDEDENLDEARFRTLVRYILDAGVHGISPGGSTGEGCAIRAEERVRMIGIIREENREGIPIVAGIICHSTRDAVSASLQAKESGADALMVTPLQYLGGTDDDGNYQYYQAISESVGLPIIIYNVIPQNEITPELCERLLDIDYVVGIKQSRGGVGGFMDMKLRCGEKGLIYAALDELPYTTYELGADGEIAAILGLFPAMSMKIWNLYQQGAVQEGLRLQQVLYTIWRSITGSQFPRRMKAALQCLGIDAGISLSPLCGASQKELAEIKEAVALYRKHEHLLDA